MPEMRGKQAPSRIRIEHPAPAVDCGRWPVKAASGDVISVSVDVFRDGHEVLRAVVRWRGPGDDADWREAPLHPIDAHHDGVRWAGEIQLGEPGTWTWTVRAWTAPFASWRDEVARKLAAGQPDLSGEASEGAVLISEAARRAKGDDRSRLASAAAALEETADVEAALDPELDELVERWAPHAEQTTLDQRMQIEVDRAHARFGSWYELFPRSWGGFKGVEKQLPRLAELGFDVLYLPPIHPIGHTNRKGRNNSLVAAPGDPGSPR